MVCYLLPFLLCVFIAHKFSPSLSLSLSYTYTCTPEHSGWQEFTNGPLAQARRIQECYDGSSISAPKFIEEEGGARVGRGGRGGSLDGLREGGIIQTLRGRGRGVASASSSSSSEASASTGTTSIIQALGGRGRGRGEGGTTTTAAGGGGRGRGRGRGSATSGSSVF